MLRELLFGVFAGNIMTIYVVARTQKFKFLIVIDQSCFYARHEGISRSGRVSALIFNHCTKRGPADPSDRAV
jgi:hypothetical protein